MRKSLLLALVLALAGCTALPTSGPVQSIGSQLITDDTQVQYLPSGPGKGASPQQILDGFLAAGAAPQDGYRIARLFLTDDASAEWNPLQESIIRGTNSSTETEQANVITMTTSVAARVTRGGFYSTEKSGASQTLSFQFEKVEGEWRISSAPNVILISRATFESVYLPFTVFFYNPERTALVPEVRYFPRQGDPTTEVARAVIAGPSGYLPDASTAFPSTASLVVSPVEVVDGRALVDVSADVLKATLRDQRAMLVQMSKSLEEISGISAVSLTVDRNVVTVSEAGSATLVPDPLVNDKPLILREGVVGFADAITIESLGKLSERIASTSPTSISYDGEGFAAVGSTKGVFAIGQNSVTVSSTPSRVEPQVDGRGSVWWVDTASPSQIEVYNPAKNMTLTGPWGSRSRIVAVEVSREDARVAIATDSATGPALYVASISRDANGVVRSIGGFHQLPVIGDSVLDIAWANSTSIAVLTRNIAISHVEMASIGGVTRQMGQPENPVTISGGNGISELVVRSADGQLWQPRGGGWQSFGIVADILATQH